MREICTSGSEGGGVETNRLSLPLSEFAAHVAPGFPLARPCENSFFVLTPDAFSDSQVLWGDD